MRVSVQIYEKNGEYVANCPELEVFCYGDTPKNAMRRIRSVIEFYIEAAKEMDGSDVDHMSQSADQLH